MEWICRNRKEWIGLEGTGRERIESDRIGVEWQDGSGMAGWEWNGRMGVEWQDGSGMAGWEWKGSERIG
jgi:hypothetical protein